MQIPDTIPVDPKAVADHLSGIDAAGPDPIPRYLEATRVQALHQQVANEAARIRSGAVAELNALGLSYRDIADALAALHTDTAFSRARAQQLAERGRCAHRGCKLPMTLVAGGIGYCTEAHVPDGHPVTYRSTRQALTDAARIDPDDLSHLSERPQP